MAGHSPSTPDYDVRDAKLPGNSLLDAIFNRRLMSWSDRGGASMLLGDAWAEHCRRYLVSIIGQNVPVPGGSSFALRSVLRLDDNPTVEREANLNQLENPDFLLVGEDETGRAVVQASDAKFAADRIKESQVSVKAVEDLLRIPETGATRALLASSLNGTDPVDVEVVPGVFLSPDSRFTDALIHRSSRGRDPNKHDDILVRIPVDPGTLFEATAPVQLVPTVARLDRLPVSPRENLLAAVYYLRVASACFYLWDEQTRPLFDAPGEPIEPETGLIAGEVARRAVSSSSAYGLLAAWHRDLQQLILARKAIADAISLPIGVEEIRSRMGNGQRSPRGNAEMRRVRGALERSYRDQLLNAVGTIHSDDPRPVKKIVKEIRTRSRELRPDLIRELEEMSGGE
ncbi:hypothetical protein BH23CHL2_BH23CHL2_13130 [soil metagenome]